MENILDKDYWNKRYQHHETGWDIGTISTPLKTYIDQLTNKDLAILIPGCGNAYEAAYLLGAGFTNITLVDISPVLVDTVRLTLAPYLDKGLQVICDDFFNLDQQFDLVLEQTFFCALDPSLRQRYVAKMYEVLKPGAKLVGVLFNRDFEGGLPFGGSKKEYEGLFAEKFNIITMEACYNSITPRKGNELFVILRKD